MPKAERVVPFAAARWGQDEDRRRSRETGFNHHMVKPVDPQQPLVRMLDRLDFGHATPPPRSSRCWPDRRAARFVGVGVG